MAPRETKGGRRQSEATFSEQLGLPSTLMPPHGADFGPPLSLTRLTLDPKTDVMVTSTGHYKRMGGWSASAHHDGMLGIAVPPGEGGKGYATR